jgi:hypothetical protein
MPDRVCINGQWYVREDALPQPSTAADGRWEPVRALCQEYGVDPHAAYAAAKAGRLDAKMPSGAKRGLRCRRSEFVRWMDERMGAWCE